MTEIEKLKTEFHQLRYDDKDFENQYNADEFQEWLIDVEYKEWVNYCCRQFKTDFENLPEATMLEIIEFLKEDGFSEVQIYKAINK